MVKKSIYSFLLIFFIQLILSCINCNCPDPKAFKFDFDNLVYEKAISKENTVNEIAFRVSLKDSSTLVFSNQNKGTFLNSAFACKCNFLTYGVLKSNLKRIKILTKNNFDSKYNAGADVSVLFVASENNNENTVELYNTFEQLIQKFNDKNYYYNYDRREKITEQILFYLKVKSIYKKNIFLVQFEFENGTKLITETEEFSQI